VSPDDKNKLSDLSVLENKFNIPNAVNDEPKWEEEHPKESQKFGPRQSTSAEIIISAKNGKAVSQSKDEKSTTFSLLDKILALNNIKDPELINNVKIVERFIWIEIEYE
jgi:hypothetical protein